MMNWIKVSYNNIFYYNEIIVLDIQSYRGEIVFENTPKKVEIKEKKEIKMDKGNEIIMEQNQQHDINEENQNKDMDRENKLDLNEENNNADKEKELNKTEEEREIEDKKEEEKEETEQKEEINEEREREESEQKEETNEEKENVEENKENINEENIDNNNQVNETVDKIKALFESIKNFDQLKNEVYEMKKHYETLNKIIIKNFEEKEKNNLENFNQKFSDLNKKLELLMGDIKPNDLENNDPELEGYKPMNLSEINTRLRAYQFSKANVTDLNSLNDEFDFRIKELGRRFSEFKISIFGTDKDDPSEEKEKSESGDTQRSKAPRLNFVSKTDFENFKGKSEEEFRKLWEEINNIKLLVNDFNTKIKNKASLEDLEDLKNIILQKTEELFLSQNKKYVNFSSSIKILQDNFKKLLKLLSDKEQYYENNKYQMEGNPMAIGGHSCASCETYIGDLRTEQKFVSWNQFPKKERDNSDILKRVQNGYSRLLQMINFDSNGNPSLNPYTSSINNETNISSNVEDNTMATKDKTEINQSFTNKRLFSTKVKKITKENNKTIDILNSKKEQHLNKNSRKLPSIKASKSIDNLQKLKYKSNQNSNKKDINFINPAISQIIQDSEEKNT